VLTVANKQLFISESHDDSNRCTPYRGNLIHTTHTLPAPVHVRHSYASYGQSPYVATFHESSTALDSHCSWEKGTPAYILSTPVDRSIGLYLVSLPFTTIEAVEKVKHPLTNKLPRFTRPISTTCDQCIQYLFTGVNPSVLNRHKRGYNLGGIVFPHHTLRPSQPTILRFPHKGPARSQINHPTLPTGLKMEQTLNLLSRITKMIGLSRINRKVDPSATTVSYNSYQLNAQSTKT
jgi:hypothetical protein